MDTKKDIQKLYAEQIVASAKAILPVGYLDDGEAAILVVSFARHGHKATESIVGGVFTNVEIAQERMAEIIDDIYSDKGLVGEQ